METCEQGNPLILGVAAPALTDRQQKIVVAALYGLLNDLKPHERQQGAAEEILDVLKLFDVKETT